MEPFVRETHATCSDGATVLRLFLLARVREHLYKLYGIVCASSVVVVVFSFFVFRLKLHYKNKTLPSVNISHKIYLHVSIATIILALSPTSASITYWPMPKFGRGHIKK